MPSQTLEKKIIATVAPHPKSGRLKSFANGLRLLLVCAIPALLTGGLLWLSHFPVAWGWLGWLALVPLLFLIRSRAPGRRVFLAAWLGALVFFWPALQWMRVADPQMYYTWAALATYCALYVPVAILLIRQLDRRTELPLVISAPIVWTALEFMRSHLGEGFPWYLMSHTQHDFLPIIQISDLTGAHGVTFLLVAVNAVLAGILFRLFRIRRLAGPEREQPNDSIIGLLTQASVVALLIAGALIYGDYRLHEEPFSKGPRLALIQCNLEQDIRNSGESGSEAEQRRATETMDDHYRQLQRLAAKQGADLIVWPESSHVQGWGELSNEFSSAVRTDEIRRTNKQILGEAVFSHTNVLFGLSTFIREPSEQVQRYNSAVLINAAGQYIDRYDKMHRVPFGEYMPFVDWFPWIKVFSPYGDADYSIRPGERFTRFPVGDYRFGVVICFEDTDPALARKYAGGDGQRNVDFLLNISNDGWFKGTSEHEEHLAISRFRAVECRRSLARAANMGISAIIDGNGRVLAPEKPAEQDAGYTWSVQNDHASELPVRRWSEFKKVKGVLTGVIPIDHRSSLYARSGDWLPWSCWLSLAAFFVFGWLKPARRIEGA